MLDEPFLRLEAPMRKVIVAILSFIAYPLPHFPHSLTPRMYKRAVQG